MHDMLDSSRDKITLLQGEQSELAASTFFEDEEHEASQIASESLASEIMLSPDMATSHAETSPRTSVTGASDWLPQASDSMLKALPHGSGMSSSTGGRLGQRRRSQPRVPGSAAIRRLGGRAVSVDMSNMMQRKLEVSGGISIALKISWMTLDLQDLEFDYQSRPLSPVLGPPRPNSPSLRPLALGTYATSIPLTFGSYLSSPVLPTSLEDSREADDPLEGPAIVEIAPSPEKLPQASESVVRSSSLLQKAQDAGHSPRAPMKDIGVQTESRMPLISSPKQSLSTGPRLPHLHYQSSVLSSEAASDPDYIDSSLGNYGQNGAGEAPRGNRTAAVAALIDNVMRLLTKLKGADIYSLEQRLKKQNLPGDVAHLAKSTIKDIVSHLLLLNILG